MLNFFNIIKINNIFEKENCDKILFVSSEYREKLDFLISQLSGTCSMKHIQILKKCPLMASIFINELLIIILLETLIQL